MSRAFHRKIRQSLANENLQCALDDNAQRRRAGRITAFASLADSEACRQRAHALRADVIANLSTYLEKFKQRVADNGITIHHAANSTEAVQKVLEIIDHCPQAQAGGSHPQKGKPVSNARGALRTPTTPPARTIVKSKSMVSEEIHLNQALEAAGHTVLETDLGEYIVQLRGERPAHIITPSVHLQRGDVGRLFAEKLGIPFTEDIPSLTAAARGHLRQAFLRADIGISGVNFGVVETGTLCLVTNEGNGRMVTTLPPVHIALMGIERLVPSLDDLALMLALLPRSATGQKLSVYTSLIHGPRRDAECDGPAERHLILVDNGRSALLASPLQEALYCIRCGACLNACPVFQELSGHAYVGTDGQPAPYPGPIGSVISPGMFGGNFSHLAQASSLCGACRQACPVDMDLPGLLLRVRAGKTSRARDNKRANPESQGIPGVLKLGLRLLRHAFAHPGMFAALQKILAAGAGLFPRSRWVRLPAFTGWGYSRDFPLPAARPFRQRFKPQKGKKAPGAAVRAKASIAGQSPPTQPRQSLPVQFTAEYEALGGVVVSTRAVDMPERLAAWLIERGIKRVLVDDGEAEYCQPLRTAGIALSLAPDADVRTGLSGALAGIAETGTLLLADNGKHALTASLLPETHIAILHSADILPGMAEALRLPQVRQAPTAVLISGPSRTADIEMTLTIGVHGPKELIVFLVDDSPGG